MTKIIWCVHDDGALAPDGAEHIAQISPTTLANDSLNARSAAWYDTAESETTIELMPRRLDANIQWQRRRDPQTSGLLVNLWEDDASSPLGAWPSLRHREDQAARGLARVGARIKDWIDASGYTAGLYLGIGGHPYWGSQDESDWAPSPKLTPRIIAESAYRLIHATERYHGYSRFYVPIALNHQHFEDRSPSWQRRYIITMFSAIRDANDQLDENKIVPILRRTYGSSVSMPMREIDTEMLANEVRKFGPLMPAVAFWSEAGRARVFHKFWSVFSKISGILES